ncbi:hypothetical protein EE612_050636 [Oryza sativa]|nr:hypothetical protein EE612_050636 [Oryza sativa]
MDVVPLPLLLGSLAVSAAVWYLVYFLRGGSGGDAARKRRPFATRATRVARAGQPAAARRQAAPHHVRPGAAVRPAVPAPVRLRRGGGGRVGARGCAVPARARCQLQQPPAQLGRRARRVQLPGPRLRALRCALARPAEAVRAPPLLGQGARRPPSRPGGRGRAHGEEPRSAAGGVSGAGAGSERLRHEHAGPRHHRSPGVRRRRRGRRKGEFKEMVVELMQLAGVFQRRGLRAGAPVARPAGRRGKDEEAAPSVRQHDERIHQRKEGRGAARQGSPLASTATTF